MQAPRGWYPNPANPAEIRWWDGDAWTTHTAPAWSPSPQAPLLRRRRIWPWIVFPVLGVLILFGVGAALVVPRIVGEFTHPIDAANVYLRDIRDQRFRAAYDQACALRYGTMTFEAYVQVQRDREAQDGRLLRFNAHQVHRVAGHGNQAIVDIDLTTTERKFSIEAFMQKENGHWHWCGLREVSSSS